MAYPIKICVVCGEEFELKPGKPGKPGFANRGADYSEEESANPRKSADPLKADRGANAARREAMRNLLYRKDNCTFCAFYRPLKGPAAKEGYILDFDTIYEKIRETVELGGTGVLMQGGLHPDLKIDWHEKMLRGIKERFPKVHLHCFHSGWSSWVTDPATIPLSPRESFF